jgi:hypothetical protein
LRLAACGLCLLACAEIRHFTPADRLSDADQLDYLVLLSLAPDAARAYATQNSAKARADYLDWFWRNPPSGLESALDSALPALPEFYRGRARDARSFFGALDLLNDDRVPVYIRHGPARREQFDPQPVRNESTLISVNPAELWTYDSLGRQFDFVKSGTAYRLVGESRFGPNAVMPALEPVDLGRPAPAPAPDARPLELELRLSRMRQQSDTVEVELACGIPLRVLRQLFPPPAQALICFQLDVSPRHAGRRLARTFWMGCRVPADTGGPELTVSRDVFRLPADLYTVTLSAAARDGKAWSQARRELNLIEYVRHVQPASDVVLCSLIDSFPQSPQFGRPDLARVVPLVAPRVRTGSAFYALYEIYNLTPDSAGRHDAEANYEIMERDTRALAVLPAPTRHLTGDGTTATAVERVHTMDLRPGNYLLVSRVRDLNNGRTATVTAEFEILPRR